MHVTQFVRCIPLVASSRLGKSSQGWWCTEKTGSWLGSELDGAPANWCCSSQRCEREGTRCWSLRLGLQKQRSRIKSWQPAGAAKKQQRARTGKLDEREVYGDPLMGGSLVPLVRRCRDSRVLSVVTAATVTRRRSLKDRSRPPKSPPS